MTESAPRPQFTLIQALRGFAALWVVLFHLEKNATLLRLTAVLPSWITLAVFQYGRAGVSIFFVLSGFVICHSLHGKALDGRGVAQFLAKRSMRLDPPYWASMAFMTAAGAALALAKGLPVEWPGVGQVVAHMLYLQTILGVPEIQFVYWTLTYEFQFYIIFAIAMWMMRGVSLRSPLFWILYALAMASALLGEWAFRGLFVNLWHGFFLGVLAYEAGLRRQSPLPLYLLVLATVIGAGQYTDVFGLPCAVTAMLLFWFTRAGRLGTMASPLWQGLGAISYSLYLVHIPVLALLTGVAQRILGEGAVKDALVGGVLILACLGVAWIFNRLIENPSKRLATMLFSGRRRSPVASAALERG